MGFALPSGVVNTDTVYLYADQTLALGPITKQLADQTLVVADYSNLTAPLLVNSWAFSIDVSSNPELVVSYPQSDAWGRLTFLVSGGIEGQQYNLSLTVNGDRTDVLTINIPSSDDCGCGVINPVPTIYNEIPLGEPTQGYANTAVRYFWGSAPPSAPNIMDQWYNPDTQTLYEWATDGTEFFWQIMMSGDVVSDAPLGTTYYSRYNGYWAPDPIQSDAPSTGLLYSRVTGGWQPSVIQIDAPTDGAIYARQSSGWVPLPQQPILSDAPIDGNVYGRLNAGWTVIPPQVITVDAPADNNAYMRSNRDWSSGGTLTGSLNVNGNVGIGSSLTVGANMFVDGVTTFGAQVALAYDPIQPLQAATKQYVDNEIIASFALHGSPFLQLAGGTMNGPIELAADPINPMEPVTLEYFNAHSAAGLTDAVADGTTYGRMNHTWVNVLPLTGGTLTGALILAAPPTLALGAATKGYVDSQIAGNLAQPSTLLPLMDGTATIGSASTYARADHVHPSDTSRYAASNPAGYQTAAQVSATLTNYYPVSNPAGYQTAAQVAASLANYYPTTNPAGYQTAAQVTAALAPYALTSSVPLATAISPAMDSVAAVGSAPTWARGDHVHPTDTTRASVAQLGNYLPLTGGTMTGILTLSANPVGNLDAATKQYVDNASIDCGTF